MLLLAFIIAFSICSPIIVDSSQDEYDILMDSTKLTISVPSNPTTGYLWKLPNYNLSNLMLSKQEYKPSKLKGVGTGGIQNFEFVASVNKEFTESIVLRLQRPWEIESVRTVTLRVRYKA
jgi:inhibitor of cysteine peptidase